MRYLQILIFSFLTVFAFGQLPDYTFEADSCTLTWVEDGTDTIHTWDLQSLVWGASSSMAIHWTDASGTAGSGDIMRFPAFATNQDAFDYLDSVKTDCVDLMAGGGGGYWEEVVNPTTIRPITADTVINPSITYFSSDGTASGNILNIKPTTINLSTSAKIQLDPSYVWLRDKVYIESEIQPLSADFILKQANGSTSHLFQNSAGTDLVEIDPDGNLLNHAQGDFIIYSSGSGINDLANNGFKISTSLDANIFKAALNATSGGIELFSGVNVPMSIGTGNTNAIYIDASQNVGIGTTSPNTTLEVNGGLTWNTTTAGAGNYTVLITDYIILKSAHTGGGTDDVILPSTAATGQVFNIKDADGSSATNNFDITTAGAELIDGAASLTISSNYANIKVVFDGTNYLIL